MSIVAAVGFADGAVGAAERVGDTDREVVVDDLLAMEFVDDAFCSVAGAFAWTGFGAAYLESSFETLVWLGFFWCCVVVGRVVFGLEDISRAEIWRVSWFTEVDIVEVSLGGTVSKGRD